MSREPVEQDRGATLLWMALMMVVFLGMAAIVVDLGMAWAVKRQLSSTADAVALAGAQEAGLRFKSTNGCPIANKPDQALVDYIEDAVEATHNANAPLGSTGVPTPTITCDPTQVSVTVTERSSLQTFFGPILGVTSLQPGAAATANVFGSNSGGGLRPFTVCMNDAAAGALAPDTTQQSIYAQFNDKLKGETLVAAGNLAWTSSDNKITAGSNPRPSKNDYVRIDIKSGAEGATSGMFWVVDTGNGSGGDKWFTVSATYGGSAQAITSDGVVDVYIAPAPVGGTATWAQADDVITTENAHGLAVDTRVRIAIKTPTTQNAFSGFYYVKTAASKTMTVSTTLGGPVFDLPTSDVTALNIYSASSVSSGSCNPTGSPGNWGYASFGLGSSQPVLKCLIEYGYNGSPGCFGNPTGFDLGSTNPSETATGPGNSGNSIQASTAIKPNNFEELLTDLLDDTIVLPVAGTWTQSGSNATYQAKGGIAVKVCGFAFPKNGKDPTELLPAIHGSCWEPTLYTDAANSPPLPYPGRLQDASLVMQWRFVKAYAGPFSGQPTGPADMCELIGYSCLAQVRLIS